MGRLLDVLNGISSFSGSTCTAVVDQTISGDYVLCNDQAYGRAIANGCQIWYCIEHVPSDAIQEGERNESLQFYCDKENHTIEVE